MASNLVPFQDLNLYPDPPATSTPIIPKIEPKLEPLEEPPSPLGPPPGLHLSNASTFPDPAAAPSPTSSDADVYAEFYRISELFRSAFAQRVEKFGDVAILPDSDPDSRAIVPVSNPETQVSDVVITPSGSRKYPTRSSELVRVTDLKPDDHRYFRDLIRRTRMLFDSLRVFSISEDEKHRDIMVPQRRTRGDLKASALMRHSGLWLNRDKRIVGDIPGVSIGDVFFFRMELCVVGLHGQPQAGIDYVPASQSSNGEPIATSIIVSGGYEDDEDQGDVIVYTGHGGQDKNNKQVVHQKLECGNLALERSMNYGVEVRVIRGFKYEGSISGKVYVYDGLYRIIETWFDVGKSGFGVFKFKLVRIENQPEMGSTGMKFAGSLRIRPLEVRPNGYITFDLSRKKETYPVFLYNDIDGDRDPLNYDYLITTVFPPYLYSSGSTTGCECVGGCMDECLCSMKNGGEFAYDMNGILVRGKPLIFECGPHCRCPPSCRNRVTQKGLRNRFEVFRSRETGWGVRSLDLIQAGSFICEYAGIVLTREQIQLFTMTGDSLIYPSRFAERWKEWGDLSQIFSDYVCPTYPSIPPLDFAMDVSKLRNVACYISHSSSPNVFVQLVLHDHNNVCFPRLMLFAMENIPPMRELSLDYGVADEGMGKLAICN
ncbi:histone H3 (Lys9) methyltransferase SUV39H1/Clr4, required for transcriptional silencing [Handroanthus impetiginosus]|uniref:Histone H3 (Lys9) methyltransferase SUV39H1/Clr4, required for transcriptional silencing n=1 Tax=Handroanthus impetiginosus TaxID=429701 RepID=A0A2G9GI61_9LAMI|nr:histone H3 (Lys9) methyltransferase SUV39H1/Clr4, required for transcriptional silencing [Handroanthus impetiginosus]